MWLQLKRIIKPRGAIALFGSQPFTSALVMSNLKWFKYEWIWSKNRGSNFAVTKYQPMKEHEIIAIFGNGATIYNMQLQQRNEGGKARSKYKTNPSNTGKKKAYNGLAEVDVRPPRSEYRCPRSIQAFNTEVGLHPTQKPIALLEYLIKTYTNEGETVLDFTIGSGTTAIAAIRTGRNYIGIEQDAGYVEIARNRIKEELAKPKQLSLM